MQVKKGPHTSNIMGFEALTFAPQSYSKTKPAFLYSCWDLDDSQAFMMCENIHLNLKA